VGRRSTEAGVALAWLGWVGLGLMGAGTRLIVSQTGPAWLLFHGFFCFHDEEQQWTFPRKGPASVSRNGHDELPCRRSVFLGKRTGRARCARWKPPATTQPHRKLPDMGRDHPTRPSPDSTARGKMQQALYDTSPRRCIASEKAGKEIRKRRGAGRLQTRDAHCGIALVERRAP